MSLEMMFTHRHRAGELRLRVRGRHGREDAHGARRLAGRVGDLRQLEPLRGQGERLRVAPAAHLAEHRSRPHRHARRSPTTTDFGYRALRRVGARRADVLRGARRRVPARERAHVPALPAARGSSGERATIADWERHLTTVFPEVRLKKVLEMRGADAVPPGLTCSLPAFWKGLLYDARVARGRLGARAHPSARGARGRAHRRRAARTRRALRRRARARARARSRRSSRATGLRRLAHAGRRDADETGFLDPVFEQLALGKSPGQVVFERWEGDWHRSVDRLIEYARY